MEDDLTFGTSIWGTDVSAPLPAPPTLIAAPTLSREPSTADSLDDFDDFGTPAETVAASGDEADDDFGDFGDFGEAEQLGEAPSFDDAAFAEVPFEPIAGPSTSTYYLNNLHFPSLSREDIVPVDEHVRDVDGPEILPGVVGTLGPVLLPTSPILAYAMKVVLDEYEYQPPQEEVVDGAEGVVDSDSVIGVRRSVIGARGGRGGRDEDLFYGEEGYDTRARESSDGQSDYVSLEDVSEY